MYFTKTRKFILAVLIAVVTFTFVGILYPGKVYALSTSDTVPYAFATGDYAFANALTLSGVSDKTDSDSYHWFERHYDANVDLTSASYVAFEYENIGISNPGLTIGVMSNGARFGTYGDKDGSPVYFVNESGTVTELKIKNGAVNFGVGAKGMVLLPLSSLSLVGWWADRTVTLNGASAIFFETNGLYNWGFSFKVGEISYYKENPSTEEPTKLLDLSTELKKDKIYKGDHFTVTFPEKATDTTKSPYEFLYPFATGDLALVNAPTATAPSDAVDNWIWYEQIFDEKIDMAKATYLAVEYENIGNSNPGLNMGVMSNGNRFGIYQTDAPVYFVNEAGVKTEHKSLYESVNFGAGAKGVILIPVSSLTAFAYNGDPNATYSNANSFYITTNTKFNNNFQIKVGEVGYYTEDPFAGGKMTKLLDLSNGVKKTQSVGNGFTLKFPASTVNSIDGMRANYPFATGEKAFENAMVWVGPTKGDTSDNWQTFKLLFDQRTDLTSATYLAIHYYAKTGTPGITYAIENGDTRYSINGSSGEEVYMLGEDGIIHTAAQISFDASNIGNSGCLLIPMSLINHQFGDVNNTLAEAQRLVFTTNSRFNWNFEIGVGEVGYYTGQPCDDDFVFHKLVDLSEGDKELSATVSSDLAENTSTMYCNKSEQMVYGDTTLVFTATGKVDDQIDIWNGGAAGTQKMTTDSYGADALLLTSTGPREGADPYTAYTIADGVHYDWSNEKGVSLWARNDSDTEVSFNLEIDVLNPGKTASRGRFNVTQGNRFWLYDVKTGKQSIYMTRPAITLPVGFEGWVRIPFEAFEQAVWSLTDQKYGAFPREFFMTEGCYVPYVGLTVDSRAYANKAFAINKIGSYSETPTFISALVPASATRKSIKELMGLE